MILPKRMIVILRIDLFEFIFRGGFRDWQIDEKISYDELSSFLRYLMGHKSNKKLMKFKKS